ncbi:MAG: hypothetical protein ACLU4J_02135 [Butyricimonas paravirosa]
MQYEALKRVHGDGESDQVIELYHRKSVPVNDYDKAVAAKQRIALCITRTNALNDTS